MTLSDLKMESIKDFIPRDNSLKPVLLGHLILKLFNQMGFKEIYKCGVGRMPKGLSRNTYFVAI
ncbi:MAG: hypothetical protein UZ09_BCD002001244 [Bacteroidetes bacterium OLB9]|nr:MAG: hypothetical protein UZ09_BCD002001244 [Bacteroidetes bacterium OLB9]